MFFLLDVFDSDTSDLGSEYAYCNEILENIINVQSKNHTWNHHDKNYTVKAVFISKCDQITSQAVGNVLYCYEGNTVRPSKPTLIGSDSLKR